MIRSKKRALRIQCCGKQSPGVFTKGLKSVILGTKWGNIRVCFMCLLYVNV